MKRRLTSLRSVRYIAATAAIMLVAGTCEGQVSFPDDTPPVITVDGFGTRRAIHVDPETPEPVIARARSDDLVRFTVRARDSESGIRRLHLGGHLDSTCIPSSGDRIVRVREPIGEVVEPPGSPEGIQSHQYTVDVAARRAVCPASTTFYELDGEIVASAENGKGLSGTLTPIRLRSFGPDIVVVGTFNLYNPGNHPDPTFSRWGTELGSQADVLILTEVPDMRRARLLADAAGLPSVVMHGDVAIASRGPIGNVQRHTVDPPGNLGSNDSNVMSAVTYLDGYPHQVVGMHWGIRDAGDVLFEPWKSAPGRLEAADWVLDELDPDVPVAFVGGDLNAYSGVGPQIEPGSTAEFDRLRTVLSDPYIDLGSPQYCSNQRIDYVLFRGLVGPLRYQACFPEASPSDHPYVLVTFVA